MTNLLFHSELPLEHFSLQYDYAKRAAKILNIPIGQTLMEFTQFWRRIHNPLELKANKIEWSFDPTTPQWRELSDKINHNEAADTVAYELYRKNNNTTETGKNYFGCFRYNYIQQVDDEKGVIEIHFKNRDTSGYGPLTIGRKHERLHDLKSMFESIRKNHPEAQVVRGGSWLYNLNSYRRLFPEIFTRDMGVEEIPFPRTSGIWGQFLTSDGKVNDNMKSNFLLKVNNAKNADQLLQCFEFKILFPRAGIESFYSHFSIRKL
jgi:hypothetical protein